VCSPIWVKVVVPLRESYHDFHSEAKDFASVAAA
jgi:hypothetical protein